MATETCKHATFLAPQWQALPTLQARKQGTTCHGLRNEPFFTSKQSCKHCKVPVGAGLLLSSRAWEAAWNECDAWNGVGGEGGFSLSGYGCPNLTTSPSCICMHTEWWGAPAAWSKVLSPAFSFEVRSKSGVPLLLLLLLLRCSSTVAGPACWDAEATVSVLHCWEAGVAGGFLFFLIDLEGTPHKPTALSSLNLQGDGRTWRVCRFFA